MLTEPVEVNGVLPCSRGRRSTTAWPSGTVFSFCFFSFCTSITVTRKIKREELAELLRQLQTHSLGAAKGLCQLWHMLILHLLKANKKSEAKEHSPT